MCDPPSLRKDQLIDFVSTLLGPGIHTPGIHRTGFEWGVELIYSADHQMSASVQRCEPGATPTFHHLQVSW